MVNAPVREQCSYVGDSTGEGFQELHFGMQAVNVLYDNVAVEVNSRTSETQETGGP